MNHDIVLDTDPGIDDLFAILMAAGSPAIHLCAVTATCGNVGIDRTTRNALRALALAGRPDVPVYRGAEQPLSGVLQDASHVHGEDGLHGAELPEPLRPPEAESASRFLVQTYDSVRDSYPLLVCIGPLTNLAQALRDEPAIAKRIPRVVAMGGGFGTYVLAGRTRTISSAGNTTPHAEFNMHCDPVAAQEVFSSGVPVTLLPLDTTLRTRITPPRLEVVRAMSPMLAGTLERYSGYALRTWGEATGAMHDPNTLAWVIEPGIYTTRRGRVSIVTQGDREGETTLAEAEDGPHEVAFGVDAERFFALLLQSLRTERAG